MGVIRNTAREIFGTSSLFPETVRCLFRLPSPATVSRNSPFSRFNLHFASRGISSTTVRCAAAVNEASSGARLAQVQEFSVVTNDRAKAAGDEPIPKVTLVQEEHNKIICSFSTTHLGNSGALACQLKTRSVIRFRGPDTVKFLQGLVTNDVQRLSEPEKSGGSGFEAVGTLNLPVVVAPPVYTAILTPQGRFLFDMFLYRPAQPEEKLNSTGSGPGSGQVELELFADVDGSSLDELMAALKKYRLRSKVEIESVAEDFSCWQRFGPELSRKSSSTEEPEAKSVGWGGGVDHSGASSSQGCKDGWEWHEDPRCDFLGFRGIFPSQVTPPLVEADKESDEKHYLLWRLEKGVAEGPSEIPKGEAIPLEYNLAGLNAISFDKGCYVGQELVARTHHRGVVRKRLFPLQFLDDSGKEVEDKVVPKTEVIAETSGKKVGTITTALGCHGLGLLRLDVALKEAGSLVIQGQENVRVKAHRPDWWPHEWFTDFQ